MDILEAIKSRRSYGFVTQQPVATNLVKTILEAAAWAPNHGRIEPWAFHVFKDEGRQKLAAAMAEHGGEEKGQKAYRAPVVIAVVAKPGRAAENLPLWENYAATAAALQNMALATHGLGLAGYWRSGEFCDSPAVKKLLDVDESYKDLIMGFFYIGHPDLEKLSPIRNTPKWQDKTTWHG